MGDSPMLIHPPREGLNPINQADAPVDRRGEKDCEDGEGERALEHWDSRTLSDFPNMIMCSTSA